jgi:hypothetical protein
MQLTCEHASYVFLQFVIHDESVGLRFMSQNGCARDTVRSEITSERDIARDSVMNPDLTGNGTHSFSDDDSPPPHISVPLCKKPTE